MFNVGDIVSIKSQGENDILNSLGAVIADLNDSKKILISHLIPEDVDQNGKFKVRIYKSDLVDSDILEGTFAVFLDNIESVSTLECKKIAELKIDKLDKILRSFTHYTAYSHYKNVKKSSSKDYIPSSGKVIDEMELFNMIDASLDMWLTSGRFDEAFTEKFAEILGVNHVLTTNSGSSANLLAISALRSYKLGNRKLSDGDEVITTAAAFPTTVTPIIQNNLVPVFVDVGIGTYNADIKQVEEAISDKTKAIFMAHTLGNPFNIEGILKIAEDNDLWVIEDNCDALYSRYNGKFTGKFGHISTFSFYPAHHITMGEGGAVVTNNEDIYKILLSYRDWGRDCWCAPGKDNTCGMRFKKQLGRLSYGYDHKYIYSHMGFNLKLTDWQAAIGLAQLEKLPEFVKKRKFNFKFLYSGFKELEDYIILPEATENSDPSWFGFPITVKNNSGFKQLKLVKYLEENGIGTRKLFAGNIIRQPAFVNSDIKMRIRNSPLINSNSLSDEDFKMLPNTEYIMDNTFWIATWPGITQNDMEYIIDKFKEFIMQI